MGCARDGISEMSIEMSDRVRGVLRSRQPRGVTVSCAGARPNRAADVGEQQRRVDV